MPDDGPVLLVEDERDDVFLIRQAFERAGVPNPIRAVRDGAEAIEYLSGGGVYGDRGRYPLPCLVLTDLKMPRVSGFDLLAWLQGREGFRDLPVIVFSSSCHEADQEQALRLGASAYKIKPGDYRQLVEMAREIGERWLRPEGK